MPSDQPPTQAPIAQPSAPRTPTANEIVQTMQHGNSPLDFIKRNLKNEAVTVPNPAQQQEPVVVPQVVSATRAANPLLDKVENVTTEVTVATKDEVPTFDFEKKDEPATTEKAVADAVKSETATDAVAEEPIVEDATDSGQHFKKLRTKFKETENTLKTVQAEKEKLAKDLEKYQTGEVVPEVLQAKEQRIAELEHYEKIHNLKGSEAYKKTIAEPLREVADKIKTYAADYGIPEDVLQNVTDLSNADLNRFLDGHFDSVGALEVKALINQSKELLGKALEAEKTPAQMLAQLEAQQTKINEAQEVSRKEGLANSSRIAWSTALGKIRKEGKAIELIRKDNDHEHNQKYVDPILKQAAGEYGKFITAFAKAGIKELEPEVASALAEAVLLAHASAVALPTRDASMREAEAILNNTRYNTLIRPNVGGGTPSVSSAPARAATLTPQETARNQINSILSKRR